MSLSKLLNPLLISLISSSVAFCQLTVSPNKTATQLATKLAGPGIAISAPTLTCAGAANGTFVSVTTPIVIDSGVLLTSGKAINTIGNESTLASFNNGTAGDATLTLFAGTATHDACVLEFDFVPKGDTVSFNYQFGSEEYNNSTCGQYNDAFAFLISGPGITGAENMALVPGTTIPVTVNSINNGVPGPSGWPSFCNIANCTSMGPGSPFTAYYVDNTGGTQLTYKGLTAKLKAAHEVIPCNSYHLKMAVADAANFLYDSGVFIEAGSLQTNSYFFSTTDSVGHTINGVPHTIAKGCSPATLVVRSDHAAGVPHTVTFSFAGSAVAGVDFTAPTTAIIPAGSTSVSITVSPLPTAISGPKLLRVYMQSPFSCGTTTDSVDVHIIDSPTAHIITPDTSICKGQSFQIRASGTTGMTYNWSPSYGLGTTTIMQPVASPAVTTVYTMTATLPLAGCTPTVRSIHVFVDTATITITTPDTSVCNGASVHIMVAGSPGLTYSWSPATGLDNATSEDPVATPAVTTVYSLTATSLVGGCPAYAQITISIVTPTINILTPDTALCVGGSANIRVDGDPTFTYSWTPATGLNDATIKEPLATPAEHITYVVTANVPGTTCKVVDSVSISLLPLVIAEASGGRSLCVSQPIELAAMPEGSSYSYQWSGPNGFSSMLQNPFIKNANVADNGIYTVTVTDNNTTCSGADTTLITVGTGSLMLAGITHDQTITLGSSIQLSAYNAVLYTWTPNDGSLDNPNINNPVATPRAKTTYVVYATDAFGCTDSTSVTIDVISDEEIFIPSAFTPNNDGKNDVFRVSKLGNFRLVEMSVFNRWGEVIYHTADGTNYGWNGTRNDVPQNMGTYNYLIILGRPDGTLQPYKGDVLLIR